MIMATIDIDSNVLSILAEVVTCVDYALGDTNFIDAVDRFFHLLMRIIQ